MIIKSVARLKKGQQIKYDSFLYNQGVYYQTIKRVIDVIFSLIGSLICIPLMIIVAIAIKLDSRGPVIYKQIRLCKYGKSFTIYKLRSMYSDDDKDGAKWTEKCDSRITRVGKFIRRTKIDEIPQFFNVLKGEMSIVGPRPERPSLTYEFNQYIPGFANRLRVKPGLTGWAQINGGYDIDPGEKLRFDMEYIENMSLAVDFKIIWKTIGVILSGWGAR